MTRAVTLRFVLLQRHFVVLLIIINTVQSTVYDIVPRYIILFSFIVYLEYFLYSGIDMEVSASGRGLGRIYNTHIYSITNHVLMGIWLSLRVNIQLSIFSWDSITIILQLCLVIFTSDMNELILIHNLNLSVSFPFSFASFSLSLYFSFFSSLSFSFFFLLSLKSKCSYRCDFLCCLVQFYQLDLGHGCIFGVGLFECNIFLFNIYFCC